MTKELDQLSTLIKFYLEEMSPILSGNMFREIATAELVSVSDNEITFCINAPFYDMKKWKETGAIVHTGKKYNGMSDYADIVNQSGAFGRHNESEHWVNRVCDMCARIIPNAEVINKLEL